MTGLGWQAGAEEFDRRERPGLEELRSEFGQISCYGQPGGAWSPQAFHVLTRWEVPMYLDEGHHVGLEQQPFWFQNVFTAFNLQQNCVRADVWKSDKAAALEAARAKFNAAVAGLEAAGGGFVSIYYHPCEFSTTQFWDGVNFSRGNNPPPSEWRGSPLLAPKEAQARLGLFADLLDLALKHPSVDVVDASQLLGLYKGAAPSGPVSVNELLQAAGAMGPEITYARSAAGALSPAEVLTGLLEALSQWDQSGKVPESVEVSAPLGPVDTAVTPMGGSMTVAQTVAAAEAALVAIHTQGHVPMALKSGRSELAPESLFVAAAGALKAIRDGANGDAAVAFPAARVALEE